MNTSGIESLIDESRAELGAVARLNLSSWLKGVGASAPISSNRPSQRLAFQRWYNFKEAFSPLLVVEALRHLNFWPASCLDCFGGSGTTALTCQFLGITPTTIEVNPFLADLIEAKLASYERQSLLDDYCTVIRSAARIKIDLRSLRYEAWPATMMEPGVNGRWLFPRETFRRIIAIREAIARIRSPANRRLLRVLLGSILVDMSNVVISGKGRRYRGGWQISQKGPDDVSAAFVHAFNDALYDITAHGKRACPSYKLLRADARVDVKNTGAIDVAMFSPPYPNSFDYTDIYNVELWVLGYLKSSQDNLELRKATLRSHVQVSRDMSWRHLQSKRLKTTIKALSAKSSELWDPNLPDMIGAYFADLDGILRATRSQLNSAGAVLMTVGDSRYANVLVNVGRILAELAPRMGYRCESITPIRAMKSSAQQGWVASLNESLVCLRPD